MDPVADPTIPSPGGDDGREYDEGLVSSRPPASFALVRTWVVQTVRELSDLRAQILTEIGPGTGDPVQDLGSVAHHMVLVASELATNAFRHGLRLAESRAREPIRLSLLRRGGLVACTLNDPGAGFPALRDPSPLDIGGLGLHIVESLSLRWGWAPLAPYGKIVWAVLRTGLPEEPGPLDHP